MALVRESHPGMAIFNAPSAGRGLKPGDVIKMFDGSFHYIEYVNSSGAYAVPLASVTHIIKGKVANFTAGGRTISGTAIVEVINPLSMGGNSHEYLRYVRMVSASGDGGMAKRKADLATAAGATYDEFDDTELDETTVTSGTKKDKDMAKAAAKAAKAAAPKTAKVKVPKTVRNCACACGGETTGYFCPGHDARMHGWVAKLADGRIEPKDIPQGVRNKLVLVKTSTGFKATKPHFWQE